MRTVDISGFGGTYEAACQKMLLNGLKFLKEHPNFNFDVYKSNPQIFGLCTSEDASAAALDKAISEGMNPSGAMHHAVANHLTYIHKHGYDTCLAEAKQENTYERQTEEEIDKILLIS